MEDQLIDFLQLYVPYPLQFSISINYSDDGTQNVLKFTNDTELGDTKRTVEESRKTSKLSF